MIAASTNDPGGWTEGHSRSFIDYGRIFVPQREHQIEMIAALVPALDYEFNIVELCCGEGLLAEELLGRFPQCTVHGYDGSTEMLIKARQRLEPYYNRFQGRIFDLAGPSWRQMDFPVQAVVSSLAVHHLDGAQKLALFCDVFKMLEDGGALIIADLVEHANPLARTLAAREWDDIVYKNAVELDGDLKAFEFFSREGWNTFHYLAPDDFDKPSGLLDQLKWLEAAGFVQVDVHWMLAGHAIFSGRKPLHGNN